MGSKMSRCIGRDCGFKYNEDHADSIKDLEKYVREKIKNKYDLRLSTKKGIFDEISEKAPEFEEDINSITKKNGKNRYDDFLKDNIRETKETELIYQTPTLNTKHGNNINPHLEITISRSDKTSPNEILNKSLNDSPMILISPSPAKNIQKKDSIIEIGFQNNIFDYQNLNSPNITNHEYGDIFNEDDYNSPEIKGKYPEIEQKFPKKTLGSRK